MTKKLHLYNVIKRPIISEKSTMVATNLNQYTFEVDMDANKIQIADAVMKIFDVDVLKVHTMVMPHKRGQRWRQYYIRKSAWKKAIVTLPPGQTIGLFHV